MTDRIRTPACLPVIAAVLLFGASSAEAQAPAQPVVPEQTQAPATPAKPKRHLDVEAGVGVHFALENDVPVDDDVYAVIGLAAPISDHFDAEFQGAYFSGSQNERLRDPLTDPEEDESIDGGHFNTGVRWYPQGPDASARFYLAAGASVLFDYREDNETLAANVGPGLRLRAGDRSGMLLRVPVMIMLEEEADPIMVPTFNLFYQF
jgi:hypothetical protein